MQRLDTYLVELNKFENRSQATRAIKDKRVLVDGVVASKPGTIVNDSNNIEVLQVEYNFVSRGGQKLQGAINDFALDVSDFVALDIGSSTGGFCDCLLQNGVKQVIAVDIGTNQLHEKLRSDSRIKVFENTDFRDYAAKCKDKPTFACGDLSFIPLEKIIPSIAQIKTIKSLVLLIKPQFECGKQIAQKYDGVIRDFKEHKKAIYNVLTCLEQNGFNVVNVLPSSIKGGSGNIEYVVYAKTNTTKIDLESAAKKAIAQAKLKYKKVVENV